MKIKKNLVLTFSALILQMMSSLANIRIVCTAALTNAHYNYRKHQYLEAFSILDKLGYQDFYIIEALKKNGPTFLDSYSRNVFYATVNNPNLRNNGINEAKTLLEGCEHFKFGPEDIIIKLTGRYHLMSDFLFKIVENNPDYDAFVKINQDGTACTFGFAMKYKYLKEMLENIDYDVIERQMISIEYRVADYIKIKNKEDNFKIYYLEKLDIKYNIYGSTNCPNAPDITLTA